MPECSADSVDPGRGFNIEAGERCFDDINVAVPAVCTKGRLYDPELDRFIQADDVVEPDATQGLNRYTLSLERPA